ncbi:Neuromedin-U receptor 2 [Holothuria leucospilota]|uniref:Neuromedin-U receptor 2 n=1 Tax=Holothuria leucospilota TaxID=206669 RepID=A0A9Q1H988_HOLLE|nr:Neuromedin-U receptor 2 [Holothuria leucospilota]
MGSYHENVTDEECGGFVYDLTNATDEHMQYWLNPLVMRISALFLHPLIAVIGILGNLAFIFIVWKVPSMRNSMNIILLNLSVADFVFLLVGAVGRFVNVIMSPVLFDVRSMGRVLGCLIVIPLTNVVSFASLLLISLISCERYLAVCRPLQHLRITTRRRTLVCVSVVWVLSLALAVFLVPSQMDLETQCLKWAKTEHYNKFPTKVGFCVARHYYWGTISECLQIFPFLISLILNVVCFTKIILVLGRRMTSFSTTVPIRENYELTKQHKDSANAATRMLFLNGIAFFVLATPFHVTNVIQFIDSISWTWSCDCTEYKVISVLLLHLNSAVNPFIYGMTNRTYRQAYYSLFSHSRFESPTSRVIEISALQKRSKEDLMQ